MTGPDPGRARRPAADFWKLTGAGNDFLVVDARDRPADEATGEWVREVCRRGLSVGADGVILVDRLGGDRWQARFFNPDGEETFCANGARCAARYAVLRHRAGPRPVLETTRGPLRAEVAGERVRVELGEARLLRPSLKLVIDSATFRGDFLEVGVPHLVIFHPDPESVDLAAVGPKLRSHPDLGPSGANVNFARLEPDGGLRVRTYERGVEGETLSCGTGSVAAALAAARRGKVESPVTCRNRSGADLLVDFVMEDGRFRNVGLAGEARVVYTGRLWPAAGPGETGV